MWIRGLLLVAVAVLLSWVAFGDPEGEKFPEVKPRTTDLRQVYDRLGSDRAFRDFERWCALRVEPANRDESKHLDRELATAPNRRSAVLAPGGQIEWVRINHPTDRNQWLGVGFKMNPPSDVEHTIVARVPVGFAVED